MFAKLWHAVNYHIVDIQSGQQYSTCNLDHCNKYYSIRLNVIERLSDLGAFSYNMSYTNNEQTVSLKSPSGFELPNFD